MPVVFLIYVSFVFKSLIFYRYDLACLIVIEGMVGEKLIAA